jgi:hypothetical protein
MGRRAGQLPAAMGQHAQLLKREAREADSIVWCDAPAIPNRLEQVIRGQIEIHTGDNLPVKV